MQGDVETYSMDLFSYRTLQGFGRRHWIWESVQGLVYCLQMIGSRAEHALFYTAYGPSIRIYLMLVTLLSCSFTVEVGFVQLIRECIHTYIHTLLWSLQI